MTPQLLREIGEALDGAWEPTSLARRIGRSERTVRRWGSGEWPIPDDAVDLLRPHLQARKSELAELLRKLR